MFFEVIMNGTYLRNIRDVSSQGVHVYVYTYFAYVKSYASYAELAVCLAYVRPLF